MFVMFIDDYDDGSLKVIYTFYPKLHTLAFINMQHFFFWIKPVANHAVGSY